ncbi:uncharacterized protein LOC106755653 isoform X1 [Vigna radiata var. radiata]|uniref:Uncharacterized protein LOC106755653 isoform X1 n=1 Tax=Vigna radiata var. radiata TaxID=3916 RepID=A0A3Q0EVT1_VIGRR|nr:uncharacterized protein LOC106755653 isoform X1 [Vigna radiata var. radiata]
MSALFNFHSFLTVILLGICACTYFKMQFPAILDQKTGFRGFFWKAARIGASILYRSFMRKLQIYEMRVCTYDFIGALDTNLFHHIVNYFFFVVETKWSFCH